MLPPVPPARFTTIRPAGPAPEAMKPRPDDTPQIRTARDTRPPADASPMADPARSAALQSRLSKQEPDPIKPPPAGLEEETVVARPRPDSFEEKAIVARPAPAETAALQQATEGHAQLGSYATIKSKLSIWA